MDAIEALKSRRSIRRYKPDPVPKEVLLDIIDCARLAPTAMGEQPWEFVVVTREDIREDLAAVADYGKFIADAPVCIAVFTRPVTYYLEDGCAAVMNIITAAQAHGLGTCWVAGDRKPYAREVTRVLGAPPSMKLIALISLGYPAENPKRHKRDLSEVIHWDRY